MEKLRVKKSCMLARAKRVICPIFIIFILSTVYPILPINAENLRFGTETVLTRMASIENIIKGTSHYPAQNGYVTSLDVYLDVDLSFGFGERREGGTGGYGGPNAIAGQTYTATESGLAESICVNLDVTLAPKRMKAALYNPTDRSLIASTLEKTVAVGTGWVTFDFSTPVPITAGNSYLIVYWCEFFQVCGTAPIREGHAPVSVTAYVGGANYATLGGVFPATLPAGGSSVGWYFNIYVKYKNPPTSRNVKGAIYVDLTDAPTNGASREGPHTFLAETTPITVSGSGWYTLYFPNPPTVLAGHRYVISAWSDSGVGYVGMRYGPSDVGLLLEGHSLDAAYDGWPSSPTLVHERPDYYVTGYTKYSAYASYSTIPPNPVAIDDPYSVNEDTTLAVAAPGVLGNDNDPIGNPLTAELVTGTSSGSLTLNTDGSFTYTPGRNFHGSDSFTYKAKDASLYSNTATVTITINPVNDRPIANAGGPYNGYEGSSITFDASGSYDPDGDSLLYRWDFENDGVWDTVPSSSSTMSHTWNDNWAGSVRVEVSDGALTNEATAAVTVSNVNPVVEAGPGQAVGEGDTVSFAGSFTDAGSADTHTMDWSFGDGGTASGSLTPTHVYADDGVYTVTLTVTDDDGGVGSDTLSVTVNPVSKMPNVSVKTSSGNPIKSVSILYYSGGWKEFGVTDENGLASKDILPGTYTFRVSYAGASLDKTQNVASNPTVVFQTAAVSFSLLSSAGDPLSGGAQYYAGGWKTFGSGSTSSMMELLPVSYTFRVSYAGASLDKTQNVAYDTLVKFQTVSVTFKLLSSTSTELVGGTQYYAGGWRTFGSGTTLTTMELLPVSYTFRVSYAGASLDKTQNVASSALIVFQTVPVTFKLLSSTSSELNGGTQYYAGGWKTFDSGSTSSTMELLPVSYTFRVNYGGASLDKTQNIASSLEVVFNTAVVHSITGTCVKYYSGGWRDFTNNMEMLSVTYTFKFSDGTPDATVAVLGGVVNTIH